MFSAKTKSLTLLVVAVSVLAFVSCSPAGSDADSTDTEYRFYLINSVDGEDSSINGWYTGTGSTVVAAFCNALDNAKIPYKGFTSATESFFFSSSVTISDWTVGSWASDGNYYNANYAIWNYNSEKGWYLGNTFGKDTDTIYIISHEKYFDVDGLAAKTAGVDSSKVWPDPSKFDLVYDGKTGGYADAVSALTAWYKATYGFGDVEKYGISLKSGSTEYDDADEAATMWMANIDVTAYTAPAGLDISNAQFGYAQLAPRDLKAAPESVQFGPEVFREYTFILNNSVAGEDSTVNGTYSGYGVNPVQALAYALDAAGIANTIDRSAASVYFSDKSISDWTSAWNGSDADCFGPNYAVWNYNSEKGWYLGNTFGTDSDTVYLISHENYYVPTGTTARSLGISANTLGEYSAPAGLQVSFGYYAQMAPRDLAAAPADLVFGPDTEALKEYTFVLNNSVTGEDSSINGTYTGLGTNAVQALVYALNVAGIANTIDYSAASVYFSNLAISDWTSAWNGSDADCFGPNYAVWNYNSEKGWYLGNTFGTDSDTVYLISHENYYVPTGESAKAMGIYVDEDGNYIAPAGVLVSYGYYVQLQPLDLSAAPADVVLAPYYFLIFDTDGGSPISKIAYHEGDAVSADVKTTRSGYSFRGWTVAIPTVMPANDFNTKAIWEGYNGATVDVSETGPFVVPPIEKSLTLVSSDTTSVKIYGASSLEGKTVATSVTQTANSTGVEGQAYDFVLTADGNVYNGTVEVTLPYSGTVNHAPVVYYYDGSTLTEMKVTGYTDTTVTFETTHNSVYVVGSEELSESDNDDMTAIAITTVVVILIIILLLFAADRKKKA